MKYQKRTHWDKHRPEFLKVGFVFALSLVFMAFNYSSNPPDFEPFEAVLVVPDVIAIPPATQHPKPKLPPPPPEKIKIVEVVPSSEPVIEFTEERVFDETEETTETEYSEVEVQEPAPFVEPIHEEEKVEEEAILLFAERMPVYGDCIDGIAENDRLKCTHKNIAKHTYSHIKYPVMALQNRLEGTVVVSFVVNKEGNVEDIEILRDIGMGCGEEVMKAIKELDHFLPGKQNGRPVAVRFRFPVKFRLQ